MESRTLIFQFAKSILARVIVGTIFPLLVSFNSYACPSVSPPVDVNNIFDLSNTEGRFLTAVAECEGCENETFSEISLKIIGSDQTFKVDAWLVEKAYNNHGAFMKNFDPWHSWGGEPVGCGLVPIVQSGDIYDIYVKQDEIIWLDKHDPYMMSFFSNKSSTVSISDEYFEFLAWEIFRNASEYWTCENKRPYGVQAVDANYKKTGRKLSLSSLHDGLRCKADTPVVGLTIVGHRNYPIADWYYKNDEVLGFDIKNDVADAKIKQSLKKYFIAVSQP